VYRTDGTDGSGLTRLTTGTGIPGHPVWSPDGGTIAFGYSSWYLVDLKAMSSVPPTAGRVLSKTDRFLPTSWSPMGGGRIAGQVIPSDGSVASLGVYEVATKQFARVPGDIVRGSYNLWPEWLADGRHLVVRSPTGVAVIDAESGAGKTLFDVGGVMVGRTVGVSRDNKWITYTETATEGDLWVATIKH
jgi:Tol biopolymer transport system component